MSAEDLEHKVEFEINWELAGQEFSHLGSEVQASFFIGFLRGVGEYGDGGEDMQLGFKQMLYVRDELTPRERQKLGEVLSGLDFKG